MKKRTFYTELAYILGLIVLAFSAALMEASDLGVSMIVAPAYLLHLKLSQTFAFFTFGMAEYTLQAALLIGFFSGAFEGKFEFKDATKLRKYFE